MFSRRYYRYAILGLILISWLALIDYRNQNYPRVSGVSVESDGPNHLVSCEIWNPSVQEVHVMAMLRLVDAGSPGSGVGVTSSPAAIVKKRIGPQQRIFIREPIKGFGTWNDADVQVFVISDAVEIAKIAAR